METPRTSTSCATFYCQVGYSQVPLRMIYVYTNYPVFQDSAVKLVTRNKIL